MATSGPTRQKDIQIPAGPGFGQLADAGRKLCWMALHSAPADQSDQRRRPENRVAELY
jgi:hypothetical protein